MQLVAYCRAGHLPIRHTYMVTASKLDKHPATPRMYNLWPRPRKLMPSHTPWPAPLTYARLPQPCSLNCERENCKDPISHAPLLYPLQSQLQP
jgi:hypothetical protein